MKFLEVQWYGAFRDIPSKVKDNLLCLATLTTKKEAQHPVCLFEFWIQQFLTWMCFSSLPIHQMLRNLLDLIEVWSRHSFWSWIFHSYMQCFLKSYHTWNYSTLATVMVFHKILLWSKELMSKLEKCNTLMVTESISHNPKAAGLTERRNGFLKTQLITVPIMWQQSRGLCQGSLESSICFESVYIIWYSFSYSQDPWVQELRGGKLHPLSSLLAYQNFFLSSSDLEVLVPNVENPPVRSHKIYSIELLSDHLWLLIFFTQLPKNGVIRKRKLDCFSTKVVRKIMSWV